MTMCLIDDLRAVLPTGQVRDDDAVLDEFSHDSWPVSVIERKLGLHLTRPDVVVSVTSDSEIAAVLGVCREHGTPVTARGLGSSVTGQPLPVRGGVVLDLSGLTGEPELDKLNLMVTVPAGYRGIDLEQWLNERGYTLGHFPQSLPRSSVGGWLATKATGQFSSRYGGIEDLVCSYTVMLSEGSVAVIGSKPRAAVGPDLRELFLGSEGTLGIITQATLRVFPQPDARVCEAFVFPAVSVGLEAMRTVTQQGIRPALLRFYDQDETRHAVPGEQIDGCVLFAACEGNELTARTEHQVIAKVMTASGAVSIGPEPVRAWLSRRYDFSAIENRLAQPGGFAETIEVAHLWSDIARLRDELRAALAPYADELLFHFSHVYPQGVSLYAILLGQAPDDETALARLTAIWRTAMEVTIRCGGELSHHHGAGLAREPFILEASGYRHELVRRIKAALDPAGILNPGHLAL